MRRVEKLIALFLLHLLMLPVAAQQKINKTSFAGHPESVISDGKNYYISDVGKELKPSEKDGDGVIWKMDLAGNGAAVFASGLNAPKGSAISKGVLFVADIDHIKGFDLATGQQKYDIDLSAYKTSFLNDLVLKDENILFASATDIDKIFVVHIAATPTVEELVLKTPVHGPNGIVYNRKQNRLYTCTFDFSSKANGTIGYIDLGAVEKTFTKLTDRPGFYDGIAMPDDKTLIVSDWVEFEKKGILIKFDIATKKTDTLNAEPIGGPADFMLAPNGTLVIPAMLEGNIMTGKLK